MARLAKNSAAAKICLSISQFKPFAEVYMVVLWDAGLVPTIGTELVPQLL